MTLLTSNPNKAAHKLLKENGYQVARQLNTMTLMNHESGKLITIETSLKLPDIYHARIENFLSKGPLPFEGAIISPDYKTLYSYDYLFIVYFDTLYFGEYLDLPGCMACAETIEKLVIKLEQARLIWIKKAKQMKRHIPLPGEYKYKNTKATLDFSEDLKPLLYLKGSEPLEDYCKKILTTYILNNSI